MKNLENDPQEDLLRLSRSEKLRLKEDEMEKSPATKTMEDANLAVGNHAKIYRASSSLWLRVASWLDRLSSRTIMEGLAQGFTRLKPTMPSSRMT